MLTVEQHLKRADKLLSDPAKYNTWEEFDARSLRAIAHMMMAEFKEKNATNTE